MSNVIPKDEAIKSIKKFTEKTYGRKGEKILKMNYEAIDKALDNLHEVKVPEKASSSYDLKDPIPEAPEYVRTAISKMISYKGDELPVSVFPDDGTYPTGTTKWEKGTFHLKCLYGILKFVYSAVDAPLYARMLLLGLKYTQKTL